MVEFIFFLIFIFKSFTLSESICIEWVVLIVVTFSSARHVVRATGMVPQDVPAIRLSSAKSH